MSISAGKIEYQLGCVPVTGCGLSWSADELETALSGPVAALVYDNAGKADLAMLISGLPDTDFDQTAVGNVLSKSGAPEDWRVGEALAESYLAHHRNCHFPWPDGRDERKSGSSLPGADLVGFQNDGKTGCFAFGEVKTSSEGKYPPSTMHGETGLKQQLEDLRDRPEIRKDLVRYLGYRATYAPWKDQFKQAVSRYLKDLNDVRVFGLMVRDVVPHQDDLRVRVSKLGNGCPSNMAMELLAIYLPEGSIATLSNRVAQSSARGEA